MSRYTKIPIDKLAILLDENDTNRANIVYGVGPHWFINNRSIFGYVVQRVVDTEILRTLNDEVSPDLLAALQEPVSGDIDVDYGET